MQIFCAVLYMANNQVLSASIDGSWWSFNAYEKNIRNHFPRVAELIKNQIGIHMLKWDKGFYYAFVFENKTAVLALDQTISDHAAYSIYQHLQPITHVKELQTFISEPDEAIQSKADKIEAELKEVKNIALNNINKILERGEKIESLVSQTSDLANQTVEFKKKSDHLNRTCPGLFSIFSTISSYIWKTPAYEYHEIVHRRKNK